MKSMTSSFTAHSIFVFRSAEYERANRSARRIFQRLRDARLACRLYVCQPRIDGGFLKSPSISVMSAPTISQYAALAALEIGEPFVREMHAKYDRRRKFLVSSLNEMGLDCFEPKGAFYAFPDVSSTGMDGDEFAEKLLVEKEVAVVPGSGFGKAGKNHVRIAYCKSYEEIEIALNRIREFVDRI